MQLPTKAKCPECGREFDLTNEEDAAEYFYGHDCEPPPEPDPATCDHEPAPAFRDHRGCFHRYCVKCGTMLLMWDDDDDD